MPLYSTNSSNLVILNLYIITPTIPSPTQHAPAVAASQKSGSLPGSGSYQTLAFKVMNSLVTF